MLYEPPKKWTRIEEGDPIDPKSFREFAAGARAKIKEGPTIAYVRFLQPDVWPNKPNPATVFIGTNERELPINYIMKEGVEYYPYAIMIGGGVVASPTSHGQDHFLEGDHKGIAEWLSNIAGLVDGLLTSFQNVPKSVRSSDYNKEIETLQKILESAENYRKKKISDEDIKLFWLGSR